MLQSFLGKNSIRMGSAVAGLVVAAAIVTIYCIASDSKVDDGETPKKRRPPYLPSTLPLLGNTLDLMRNAPRLHDWLAEVLLPRDGQPIMLYMPGKADMLVTARPEHFEEILKTQIGSFPKSESSHDIFFDLGGDTITTTNGDTWKRQRQVFLSLFSARSLREHMMPVTQKYAAQLCSVLTDIAASKKTTDFFHLIHRYTLDVFAEIGFGSELGLTLAEGSHPHVLEEALEVALHCSARRMNEPTALWRLKRWLNVGTERKLRNAVQVVDEHIMGIVSAAFERTRLEREGNCTKRTRQRVKRDIISIILDRMQTDEEPMEPRMVRDIAVAAVIAGRDTTADSLGWFFHVLAQNPRVEAKLHAEILAKMPKLATDNSYVPSVEDVSAVKYVEAAIRELMRLYPAGPLIGTYSARDVVFPDGTFVPKNSNVVLAFYTTGRLTSLWGPDADVFKPERFLDPESGMLLTMPSTKLCAFSSGPRSCVGQNLAMIEMKIVIASVVGRFHLVPDPQQKEVVGTEGITIGMKHPLLMRVKRVAAPSVMI